MGEKHSFLLIAFLVTVLLFLPIITDVVADSVSNRVTSKITETKKLVSIEEANKLVQPSTSTSEVVKTSSNSGKEYFFNANAIVPIQTTVSGAVTLQLTTKLLDLVILNEIITQTQDYLEKAYGLTVALLIGIFAGINFRKNVNLPIIQPGANFS